MTGGGKWGDLGTRLASGVILAGIGLGAIWAGGIWFAALALVCASVMVWELAAMQEPSRQTEAKALAVSGGVAMAAAFILPGPMALVPLLLPGAVVLILPRCDRLIFAAYGSAILIASFGLVWFREHHGMLWLGWLVAVIAATDISGYFAGRLIGGPKFWPRVSPKKTWAGIIAGWIGAAAVGYAFLSFTTAGRDLPSLSAALAFASQMGDVAESAIKRHVGVKDSSRLIPGHGGLMDRFDALLGGALFMLVLSLFVVVPVVRV
ncbi:phosphatidate cytidylyltransferase [Ostreiculturibacter nitratireducens]|uniref:phosphatidate cytidylyltransferase n=1 Tax=Ostreiculturibacter nitratireducens TaxID=3075226 RepID=UPI0031B5F5F8